MLNRKSKYPIGLDLGKQTIYAAQFKETRQGLAVRGLLQRELKVETDGTPEAGKALVSALRQITKHKQFLGRRVVARLPPQEVLSFPLHFQVGGTETLEAAILRKSKEYLPFPIEEAVIDYPSIASVSSGDANNYKATIVAVRRNDLNRYLLMFKQAGLSAEVVEFGISALMRLHNHLSDLTHDPIILCNIGRTQTLLSIAAKENIFAQRMVPWGLELLLKKLRVNLELLTAKAGPEIILKKYGLLYEERETCDPEIALAEGTGIDNICRAIYQIITPHIEKLIHEFHKIIGYVRSEEQSVVFEGIYMYGHANLIHHLDRYLEKRLHIPTRLINPMAKVPLSDDTVLADIAEGGPFAVALGLAMRKVTWL